jgi:hypothetical protein
VLQSNNPKRSELGRRDRSAGRAPPTVDHPERLWARAVRDRVSIVRHSSTSPGRDRPVVIRPLLDPRFATRIGSPFDPRMVIVVTGLLTPLALRRQLGKSFNVSGSVVRDIDPTICEISPKEFRFQKNSFAAAVFDRVSSER